MTYARRRKGAYHLESLMRAHASGFLPKGTEDQEMLSSRPDTAHCGRPDRAEAA